MIEPPGAIVHPAERRGGNQRDVDQDENRDLIASGLGSGAFRLCPCSNDAKEHRPPAPGCRFHAERCLRHRILALPCCARIPIRQRGPLRFGWLEGGTVDSGGLKQPVPIDNIDAPYTMNLESIDVRRLLEQCSPRDRGLLERSLQGYSAEEIAKNEGITSTGSRVRMLRIRQGLRARLAPSPV